MKICEPIDFTGGQCLTRYYVKFSVVERFFRQGTNIQTAQVSYTLETVFTLNGRIGGAALRFDSSPASVSFLPVAVSARRNWRNNGFQRPYIAFLFLSGNPQGWSTASSGFQNEYQGSITGSFPASGDFSVFNSEWSSMKMISVRRFDGLADNCGNKEERCRCESIDETITCIGQRGGICCIPKSKIADWCRVLRSPPR